MQIVNILWTGGWDSTFRVIQLAQKDVIIQPYYLKDNRKSEENELKAIQLITTDIRALKSVIGKINDVITINVTDIEEDNDITDAYQLLFKKKYFGNQYDWLARFAKQFNSLELTIHQDDKAFSLIQAYGSFKKYNDGRGEFYKLDQLSSSNEIYKIFGNFDFPILKYSKLDMKKEAEEKGFIEIMNKTWFCQRPINNQPCGQCNPCEYTIKEGLSYRFNKSAIKRYKRKKNLSLLKNNFIYKVLRRIRRFLKN